MLRGEPPHAGLRAGKEDGSRKTVDWDVSLHFVLYDNMSHVTKRTKTGTRSAS